MVIRAQYCAGNASRGKPIQCNATSCSVAVRDCQPWSLCLVMASALGQVFVASGASTLLLALCLYSHHELATLWRRQFVQHGHGVQGGVWAKEVDEANAFASAIRILHCLHSCRS